MATDSRDPDPAMNDLRAAIHRACQPTTARYIVDGRDRVAAMPRQWVLANIEAVARDCLDLGDYWEYGRFLELLDHLGARDLLGRFVEEGLRSADADVRDMSELWRERTER